MRLLVLHLFGFCFILCFILALPSNCAASVDPTATFLTIDSANACDGTDTDAACTSFTCSVGYNGGSVTCQGDGSWLVVDCTPDTGCDGIDPSGSFFTLNSALACDGTFTDATCSSFQCVAGYEGGTLTCQSDGAWDVIDCTGKQEQCRKR